ncbi:hypothetical protein PV797_11420 [Clostridiaceae bacterium M8S5]|nr:hypothetical protein PV797_11420 [Clostridiaceae bacterium M8S5]
MFNFLKDNYYLIETSKSLQYFFYKTKDNSIYYDLYDNNRLSKKEIAIIENGVLEFTVNIDANDEIHLIFITDKGKINHYILKKSKWIKHTLYTVDIKSNLYNNLQIKFIQNNIHIFYSTCNYISPTIWTIKHIVNTKKGFEKRNVISYTANKMSSSFKIDYDSFGTIYLLYKNFSNKESHIYLISTNATINKWGKQPTKISYDNSSNSHPYLFVDNKDNVHVIWCTLTNNNLKLNYKKLAINRYNKIVWNNISLPEISFNSTHPFIYQYNNKLYIIYRQNSTLKFLVSYDHGYKWDYENYDTYLEGLLLSNIFSNKITKMRHGYIKTGDIIDIVSFIENTTNDKYTCNQEIVQEKTNNEIANEELEVDNDSGDTDNIYHDINLNLSKDNLIDKSFNNIIDILNNILKEYNVKKSHTDTLTHALLNIRNTVFSEISTKNKIRPKNFSSETIMKQNENLLKEINTSIQILKDKQFNIYEDIDIMSSYLVEIKSLISKENKSKIFDKIFKLLN